MTDYRDLTPAKKKAVELLIKDDTQAIKDAVLKGDYCADCLMIYYNCLCSHDD
jgi:hypothetical protein